MGIIASITSGKEPQPGQQNRSSDNFSLVSDDNKTIAVRLKPADDSISFNIMQDRTWAPDPVVVSNTRNGTIIDRQTLVEGNNYYVANPQHAKSDFTVELHQD